MAQHSVEQRAITAEAANAAVVAAVAKAGELGIEIWDEARLLAFLAEHGQDR